MQDVDLLKAVCIKDFDHFTDFGFFPPDAYKIKGNDFGLLNALGDEWRTLKANITPAFSLRNIKNIAININPVALDVVDYLKKHANKPVNMNKLSGFYAMDCIGKIAYSVDFKCVQNEGNEISEKCEGMIEAWRFIFTSMFPKLAYWFNIPIYKGDSMHYIVNFSKNIMRQREGMANPPQDVLGLMMKVRDNELKANEKDTEVYGLKAATKNLMTDDMIASTLMQFFLDGNDTVEAALGMTWYFLATHPEVQEKAIEEVDRVYEACDGVLTGDFVNELKYLDCCFSEAGRLGPFPTTMRTCTKDWTIPGTSVTIPKGMRVMVPILGVQMDPDNFPEPDKYDPERFAGENKHGMKSGSYLQFGMGPRQCIGMKIARIEAKVVMFQVLRHFRLETCEKTPVPLQWSSTEFNKVEGGCWVRPVARQH